jgi:tetratricopeptide (TPR) repeat protein
MQYFWFLFFIVYLGIKVSLSFLRMTFLFIPFLFPLFMSLTMAGILFTLALFQHQTPLISKANAYLAHPEFSTYVQFLKELNKTNRDVSVEFVRDQQKHLSSDQVTQIQQAFAENPYLDAEIQYWQNLHSIQPNSRDILWNLSLLYQAKGNHKQANQFLQQAKTIDPNYRFPELNTEVNE